MYIVYLKLELGKLKTESQSLLSFNFTGCIYSAVSESDNSLE